jgi:hypothetical protein
MLILPLIAFAGFTLAQGTLIWSIVGAVAALLAAFGAGYFVFESWLEKKRKKQYEAILRRPLLIEHFIPKSEYVGKKFAGAPPEETFPETLTIGIGKYRVMQRVKALINLTTGPIVLRFDGPTKNRPQSWGRDNPFIVKRLPGAQVMDWHGDVHPDITGTWPRFFHQNLYVLFGNRIESFGVWEGYIELEFPIHEGVPVSYKLPLRVTDNTEEDVIPFLRGWSDEGTTES